MRLCILVMMALALALPAKAAMPGPGQACPSQRAIICEIPAEIAAIPSQSQTRSQSQNQAEPPCLWKAMLAEAELTPPSFGRLTFTLRPPNDRPLQGLVPAGLERPPRSMVA